MKITCKRCKEEVEVAMYFFNKRITTKCYLPGDPEEYHAVTFGRAICPCCGAEINEKFSSMISSKDIVQLAIGQGGE